MYSLYLKIYLVCFLFLLGGSYAFCFKSNKGETEEIILTLTELNNRILFLPKESDTEFIHHQIDSIEQYYTEKGYSEYKSLLAHIRAYLHIQQGHYAFAFSETEKILENSKNDYDLGMYFLTSADINFYLHIHSESYNCLLQACSLFKNNKEALAVTYIRLLELALTTNRLKEAEETLQKIEQANIDIESLPINYRLQFYTWYITYFIYSGDIEKGKELIDKLATNKEYEYTPRFNTAFHLLNYFYYNATHQYQNSLYHIDFYLKETQKLQNAYWEFFAYTQRAQTLRILNQKQAACIDLQELIILKDSLLAVNFDRQDFIYRKEFQLEETKYKLWKNRHYLLRKIFIYATITIIIMLIFTILIMVANKKLRKSTKNLKAAQKKAHESIRAKSLFLSNMSHEIRTPLNAINGFSDLLISNPDMNQEMRMECNDIIKQNSMLLLKLLNDVLDLSNLDIRKMNFSYGNYDVIEICQLLVNMIQNIKQTDATIHFTSPLKSLILYTDENRLRQMLINLLINATKFTKEGSITLHVELEGENTAIFSVTDTGCGIPLEKQELIFSRFEKLYEHISGSGLGLSICQLIIERLGGKIWVDSNYRKGARFVFTHPISRKTNQT